MTNIKKDYNKYDYLNVEIKKNRLNTILDTYQCFGWETLNKKQSSKFRNLVEVEFVRDHNINNKDTLQYLQVNLENSINKQAQLEKTKHLTSCSIGFCLSLLSLILIISSVILFLNNIFMGIILTILSFLSTITSPIIIVKIYKKEIFNYYKYNRLYSYRIKYFTFSANKLTTGVKNEKEN